MSLWKVILITAVLSLLLFSGILVYALYPSVSDLSDDEHFNDLSNKTVTLKRDCYLYAMNSGKYRFSPLLLSESAAVPYEKKALLPAGTFISIVAFKSWRSSGNKSLVELYVLGETTLANGTRASFEYEWGNSERAGFLKTAPWQRPEEQKKYFDPALASDR
jgi:hypothetical protein